MKTLKGLKTSIGSAVAVMLLGSILSTTIGCTPAQQQTAVQVVSKINTYLPTVQSAADTVAVTIEALVPADAVLVGVADTAFDAAASTLQALCQSYLANPSATVLAQIQAAINTLQVQVTTATLNATGIKDAHSQALAMAALKTLATVVSVVFALIASTEALAQLNDFRTLDHGNLARLRPLLDEPALEQAAITNFGVKPQEARRFVDRGFERAAVFGL